MIAPRTQHRPQRDGVHAKEVSDYKRQINKLTREVSRLRKQLEKRQVTESDEGSDSMAEAEGIKPTSIEVDINPKDICKKCNSPDMFFLMTVPSGKDVFMCRVCKNRVSK